MGFCIQPMPLRTNKLEPVEPILTIKQDNPVELLRFSDANDYIVKFKKKPASGPQKLYRDYIGGMLAHRLGLPVPPFGLVYIDHSWIDEHLKTRQPKAAGGHQFISRFIWDLNPIPKKKKIRLSTLSNPEVFLHMFIFDLWIGNQDRKRSHILLKPHAGSKKRYQVYLIDHGGTLKPRSKVLFRMTQKQNFIDAYTPSMRMMDRGEEWLPFAKKIMAFPDRELEELFDSIPADWNISDQEREEALTFLKTGRTMLLDWIRGARAEWRSALRKRRASRKRSASRKKRK